MSSPNTKERKEYKEALKTWKHRCAMCGKREVHMHHIIYRRYGKTVKENLIPLCKYHHDLVHTNQKGYTEYLLDLNRSKYGIINVDDLKKKGKYSNFAIPN